MADNITIKDSDGVEQTLATEERSGAHWPKHITDHSTTGLGHGVKTVTTAGTDVALAASTMAKWVIIQAQTDNTGYVAVGASGVDATVASGSGVLLAAGETVSLPIDNLADVYIDATVSGEGVRFTYGT